MQYNKSDYIDNKTVPWGDNVGYFLIEQHNIYKLLNWYLDVPAL